MAAYKRGTDGRKSRADNYRRREELSCVVLHLSSSSISAAPLLPLTPSHRYLIRAGCTEVWLFPELVTCGERSTSPAKHVTNSCYKQTTAASRQHKRPQLTAVATLQYFIVYTKPNSLVSLYTRLTKLIVKKGCKIQQNLLHVIRINRALYCLQFILVKITMKVSCLDL